MVLNFLSEIGMCFVLYHIAGKQALSFPNGYRNL